MANKISVHPLRIFWLSSLITIALGTWMLAHGGLVGLWTVGSLIETIRDVLHRSYGTQPHLYFWQYRLGSLGTVVVAVFLAMIASNSSFLRADARRLAGTDSPYPSSADGRATPPGEPGNGRVAGDGCERLGLSAR